VSDALYTLASAPFEAACRIPTLPAAHRASRLHGHSYSARVRARLPEDFGGFAGAGVEALAQRLAAAVEPLDYADLNSLIEVPTDENLARWLHARLHETAVPGVFIAGVLVAGYDANKVFIENGRYHGDRIVARLSGQRAPAEPKLSAELDA